MRWIGLANRSETAGWVRIDLPTKALAEANLLIEASMKADLYIGALTKGGPVHRSFSEGGKFDINSYIWLWINVIQLHPDRK